MCCIFFFVFFFQAEDGIRDGTVTGVQTCALPILPSELAALHGSWRGSAASLRATAWRGPRVRYARIVRIAGDGLSIVNMLALSEADYPLPILGVDLVALGNGSAVIAADLSPIAGDPAVREQQNAALWSRVAGRPPLASAGTLPSWCDAWFSPHALFA